MEFKIFETAEDLAHMVGVGCQVLIHDGCEFHIDFVESESERGTYFMANGTEPNQYCELSIDNLLCIRDGDIDDLSGFGGGQ